MKKGWILILILLILPSIYAVEFSMGENFKQGETIITKVSGNFITPITKENIFFYRGHVNSPMQYDVSKIGDDYYIYAITTGKTAGNYSLSIEGVQYMKGVEVSEENIVKNFSITDETADFFIKQGFVVSQDDFYIEIQNLQENSVTVDVKTETEKRDIFILPERTKEASVSLKSGETKKIDFELGAGGQTLQVIELTSSGGSNSTVSYEVPVYIFSVSEEKPDKNLRFEKSEMVLSLPLNNRTKRTIILKNTGDEELKNISLSLPGSLTQYVNLSVNKIESLDSNSDFQIELSFFSLFEKEIEGDLKAKTGNETDELFISLNFISDYKPSNGTGTSSSVKTCSELNGTLFNTETEKCGDDYENVKDGWCCFGKINPIEKSSSGKIIAAIIVITIALVLVWFYFTRYRKTKKSIDLLKIAKKKRNNSLFTQKIDYNKFVEHEKPRVSSEIRRPIIKTKPITRIIEKPVIREVEKKIFIEKPKKPEPKYTGSSNTKSYHLSSCKFSKLIDKKYKIQNDSAEYFRKNKYTPCKVCLGKN